jgi:serine/threonine protein phosphatase 1
MRTKPEAPQALFRTIVDRPRRVFAVGDIHGHYTELATLLDYLTSHHGASAEDLFIFVGDYIDRGPDSKSVLERLLEVRKAWPRSVFLKGNHEAMLLAYLGIEGEHGEFYLQNGGTAFFDSYGIDPFSPLPELIEQLPAEHLEFIKGLELGVILAEFVFVHAGINPKRTLAEQSASDLLWIRRGFVDVPHNLGKTVVFGHTAFNQIHLQLPYRIGIDTGVAYGNTLSAVELVQGLLFQVHVGNPVVYEGSLRELLGSGA